MTCCPLSETDEISTLWRDTYPFARKDHRCEECGETIARGTKHQLVKQLFDGSWSSTRTCMSCVEIADHFTCGSRITGQLWADLEENFYPDMKAGGPCMKGLSPEAKARLFERRLKWLEDSR